MLKQGRALHAKALGQVLSAFLQTYFPNYVDYGFTSGLEVQLDEVAGEAAAQRSSGWRMVQ
jgi:DNA topoisomerase-1